MGMFRGKRLSTVTVYSIAIYLQLHSQRHSVLRNEVLPLSPTKELYCEISFGGTPEPLSLRLFQSTRPLLSHVAFFLHSLPSPSFPPSVLPTHTYYTGDSSKRPTATLGNLQLYLFLPPSLLPLLILRELFLGPSFCHSACHSFMSPTSFASLAVVSATSWHPLSIRACLALATN